MHSTAHDVLFIQLNIFLSSGGLRPATDDDNFIFLPKSNQTLMIRETTTTTTYPCKASPFPRTPSYRTQKKSFFLPRSPVSSREITRERKSAALHRGDNSHRHPPFICTQLLPWHGGGRRGDVDLCKFKFIPRFVCGIFFVSDAASEDAAAPLWWSDLVRLIGGQSSWNKSCGIS